MDTRRILILAASATLAACSTNRGEIAPPSVAEAAGAVVLEIAEPPPVEPSPTEVPYLSIEAALEPPAAAVPLPVARSAPPGLSGRRAIAAANSAARAPSREDGFVGGVQMFAWSPGRVFEVWAAPLRVTTLSLGAGEVLVAKAAGDTVRWQIGEAVSGEGASLRTHVLLKPLERGLETNLVLTTNRRVYLIDLRSGAADAYNAAVAWDDEILSPVVGNNAPSEPVASPVVALPEGELDARYRIVAGRRKPRWTPTSVFNDGLRTFITFPPELQTDEAPVLFIIAPDGQAQMVNYRQAGGLFVIDRLFDRAELRLGDRRPQVVRIVRQGGVS
ncbi:P-type conjugative transfer protein TrbG [Brevundimonas sp.]|uniref:P-type conjugative transfer protein TrbG n=1 Tax=Brevundimonas sp. TaxID=1871086 RepID=UPI0035689910